MTQLMFCYLPILMLTILTLSGQWLICIVIKKTLLVGSEGVVYLLSICEGFELIEDRVFFAEEFIEDCPITMAGFSLSI